jgi:CYTH domain-containing protein/CHAD domain-containing protein
MRPVLDDTVRGRVHRRLRKLARLTGKARDLEVQLEWLEAELEKEIEPSPGRDELRKAWEAEFSAAATKARAALDKGVKKVSAKLEAQLAHYRVDVRLDGRGKESSMAAVCGDLVTTYVERLRRDLSAVHGPNDVSAAHAARIAGKRLRYLLEPAAPGVEGARQVVTRLTKVQDTLGRLRDAQLVNAALDAHSTESAERQADAARLFETARTDLQAAYLTVERECLGGLAESLVTDAEALASRIRSAGAYSEIERKFLLSGLPSIARRNRSALIEQGYLPGAAIEERLRRTKNGTETRYHRAVKLGSGLERTQAEEEISEEDFHKLWGFTRGRRIRKRRYYVSDGGLTWEIDRFRDPAIVVAEVELQSANAELVIPSWIQAVLVREVTDEPEYSNAHLAR